MRDERDRETERERTMSGTTSNVVTSSSSRGKDDDGGDGGGASVVVDTHTTSAGTDAGSDSSYWAGVPWSQVSVCAACKFIDSAFDFGLYMYLPYLVLHLTSSQDTASAGYYSGLVASGRHLGHLLGAPCWGFLSDRVGSKPLLLSVLAGVAATHVGFALSTSIWWGGAGGGGGRGHGRMGRARAGDSVRYQ